MSTRILERAVRAALAYRDLMMMPVLPILAMSGGADQPERLTVHFRDCRLVVALPPRRPAKVVLCVARTEAEAGEWDKKEMVH